MLRATRLRCFPLDDEAFAGFVQHVAAEIWERGVDASTAAEVVARRLRGQYPDIRIAVRSSLAGFTENDVVWYVYRDGDIIGRHEHDLGAMHLRSPRELLARRAVETLETAGRLLARSRASRSEALVAIMAAAAARMS